MYSMGHSTWDQAFSGNFGSPSPFGFGLVIAACNKGGDPKVEHHWPCTFRVTATQHSGATSTFAIL